MALSEKEALQNIEKMRKKVNNYSVSKLIDSLLYGVLWDDEQITKTSETLYNFFHNNHAGHYIKGIILKTMYKIEEDGSETKIRSWLEKDGKQMSHDEINMIQYLVY